MRVPLNGHVLEGHVFDLKTGTLYKGQDKNKVVLTNKMGHYLVKCDGKTIHVTRAQILQEVHRVREASKFKSSVNTEYSTPAVLRDYGEGRGLAEISMKYSLPISRIQELAEGAGLEKRE